MNQIYFNLLLFIIFYVFLTLSSSSSVYSIDINHTSPIPSSISNSVSISSSLPFVSLTSSSILSIHATMGVIQEAVVPDKSPGVSRSLFFFAPLNLVI